ncbi:MAG: efflux RND transporter periplasmic adaptor subunit [Planctomycetes bacterium]|nr:efflux RND transporter periplasmic adaptor subunit [Planctomycetota bacterium]
MIRHRFPCLVLSVPSLLWSAGCGPRPPAAAAAKPARGPESLTVFGERLLLYMEYPPLVRGVPARFLAHLTVLETGEPVRSGTATLEIGAARFAVDRPKREGLFLPEGSPPAPGEFEARLVVTSGQVEESLALGSIVIHASEGEADRAARSEQGQEPPDAVPFLMESQWKVKLLLAQAQGRTLSRRLVVPARAVPPEGRSAVVSPSMGGRLVAPPSGALPRTGERVAGGQTLGFVEPPLAAADLAQLHALELELDLKALEVLRASGEAEARLQFAERERERIGRLRAEGLSTQQALEQAEQNLAVSRTERDAAGRMKESLERVVANRAAGGGRPGAPLRLPLEAPVAGTVVEVLGVPGATVEGGAPVFRILDASRLWVEGRVSEFDVPLLRRSDGALARFAALPGRGFELKGPGGGPPYVGPEVDPSSRTLLLRYEIENSDGAVRPGMLADLLVSTGDREAPVAIPTGAVVMDQGLPTAYVMLEGELFQKRGLELGVKDGEWVEVVRGVERGERVATRGAYLVRLAALSPASFGPGHAH